MVFFARRLAHQDNCAPGVGKRTWPQQQVKVGRGAEKWPGLQRASASLGHFNLLFREALSAAAETTGT